MDKWKWTRGWQPFFFVLPKRDYVGFQDTNSRPLCNYKRCYPPEN